MRKVFFSVVGVFLCAQLAWADYANPPGWENDPYFTHQSWSFSDDSNPSAPDQGVVSPGAPSFNLTAANSSWVDDLGTVYDLAPPYSPQGTRQGGWKITGSSTDELKTVSPSTDEVWFTVDVPNVENPTMYKELWFELTFRVTDMAHAATIVDNVDLSVYADGILDDAHKFDYIGEVGGAFGQDPSVNPGNPYIWLRFEGTFRFEPQPSWEQIVLTGSMLDGQEVLLDQIDIDTHCVPEPATLGLLSVGVLALIRRRKNRSI